MPQGTASPRAIVPTTRGADVEAPDDGPDDGPEDGPDDGAEGGAGDVVVGCADAVVVSGPAVVEPAPPQPARPAGRTSVRARARRRSTRSNLTRNAQHHLAVLAALLQAVERGCELLQGEHGVHDRAK